MLRAWVFVAAFCGVTALSGCGFPNEKWIPAPQLSAGGTSVISPLAAALGGAVPEGVQIGFIGDVVELKGFHFVPEMKLFLGLNSPLAYRPNSLFTLMREYLPGTPFVYTDPVTSEQTILEVEVPFEFVNDALIRFAIPPAVASSPLMTNPTLRMFGLDGSGLPVADLYYITGPHGIALTPRSGVDLGGYSVIVHGDFFSPYTQVAVRYVDPADGLTKVVGDEPSDDIGEEFIDRHTLIVPNWPGVVPNSTLGLSRDLPADLLLFENIEPITGNVSLEPALNGIGAYEDLLPAGDIPLSPNGVRNFEKVGAFTYLPTGVTDVPLLQGLTPESGSEVGGNTVIIVGQQFDAFTVDLSDPDDPGVGIECPPGSGEFVPPLAASLVDRQTIVLTMPPCPVDVPQKVDIYLKNKFSIDNAVSLGDDKVIFPDVYTYIPVPPIVPPIVTAIYPSSGAPQPQGLAHDYGLERLMVVGDWFDGDTTLNGGFEFLMPGGEVVQSVRTILHNRNLLEVFTPRLPAPYYPLASDIFAGVRVRNTVGYADFANAMRFVATPDAGATPVLSEVVLSSGPVAGNNRVMLVGANFDTSTQAIFTVSGSDKPAAEVQFVNSGLLIVTVPPAPSPQAASVRVVDEGAASASRTYTYSATPPQPCPILGALAPAQGSHPGGYKILGYGINMTPTTRMEFGVGDGNFSGDVFFVADLLVDVEVPEAFPAQIGATVQVGATDPLNGCNTALRTVGFTYVAAQQDPPQILYVDTTVEVPVTPTTLPALNTTGGDRMLVIGRNFDQATSFDLTKPVGSATKAAVTGLAVLTPEIAVMTSPASPDGATGVAHLKAHNAFGDSAGFPVEYVAPPPPKILDVRNLDDGTQSAPIDGNRRLLIFGSGFIDEPAGSLRVRMTGNSLASPGTQTSVTQSGVNVTVVDGIIIGVNVPPNTFTEGPLKIEVLTTYGTASFDAAGGTPIFVLVGPRPPVVAGVFPQRFNSNGGEEAIFVGQNFTPTTAFRVQTDVMGASVAVASARYVSETHALIVMPALTGGVPPIGAPGKVRAEEMDPVRKSKITDPDFTESSYADPLYRVFNDAQPVLLSVYPDHGFIDGGEQVLLLGANFLNALGVPAVTDIRITDAGLGDIGDYTAALPGDLPLNSLSASKKGKFFVIDDNTILLITHPRARIVPEDAGAAETVTLVSSLGNSSLTGGYTYLNTADVRTPFLHGITPNETRLNGGTSHLLSGGFLDEADRVVFTRPGDGVTFTIPVDGGAFSEVNSFFDVFVMPDLSGKFAIGDLLDVHVEKDVAGPLTLKSNTLKLALRVTFAGPPVITPTLLPTSGTGFGGTVVEINGANFTPNSQVLFGTMPARVVVFASPTKLYAVTPALPLDAGDPGNLGLDLFNLPTHSDPTPDVAVFTGGGWAVLPNGYTFTPQAPAVTSAAPSAVNEGATTRVTLTGARFLPGGTTVTSTLAGSLISNLVVADFTTLSFDYKAPSFAPATLGPKTETIKVSTSHGAAPDLLLTIELKPFVTSVTTSYTPNSHAAPTTGIEAGARVIVTVNGGNFAAGGSLTLSPRNLAPIGLTEDAILDLPAEFRVVSGTKIEFSVPYQFPAGTPTLLDGNANCGPVALTIRSARGLSASFADAFRYVPAVLDFQDYRYTTVTVPGDLSAPGRIAVGDINADGVPDVASLLEQNGQSTFLPEALVFFADTYGAGVDANGDGQSPDFTGTYTQLLVSNDSVKSFLPYYAPGQNIQLVNLDGDSQLELVLPTCVYPDTNRARVLVVDVTSAGALGTQTVLTPTGIDSDGVQAVVVGRFDSADSKKDIVIFTDHSDATKRKIVLFSSTATNFSFTQTLFDIPAAYEGYQTGAVAAGDFDGDGDEDLIWGQYWDTATGSTLFENFPILVSAVTASTGTIGAPSPLTNFSGGNVYDIEVFDADKDGKVDAIVHIRNRATGTLLSSAIRPGGIVTVLNPLNLLASRYVETGFRISLPASIDGTSATLASADFNGDGVRDVAVAGDEGEMVVLLGDDTGNFTSTGRSWQLVTSSGPYLTKVKGIDAADLNRDGLAEILMGDMGGPPFNLVVWLNASR